MLPFYSNLLQYRELHCDLACMLISYPSTLLARFDLLKLLPVQIVSCDSQPICCNTHFSCAEKSSLVSSSSQLSSHRCVLSPGTSVSSCVQSASTSAPFCKQAYLGEPTLYGEVLKPIVFLQRSRWLCLLCRVGTLVCGRGFGSGWRTRCWGGRHDGEDEMVWREVLRCVIGRICVGFRTWTLSVWRELQQTSRQRKSSRTRRKNRPRGRRKKRH
jgi:hypothetical protein